MRQSARRAFAPQFASPSGKVRASPTEDVQPRWGPPSPTLRGRTSSPQRAKSARRGPRLRTHFSDPSREAQTNGSANTPRASAPVSRAAGCTRPHPVAPSPTNRLASAVIRRMSAKRSDASASIRSASDHGFIASAAFRRASAHTSTASAEARSASDHRSVASAVPRSASVIAFSTLASVLWRVFDVSHLSALRSRARRAAPTPRQIADAGEAAQMPGRSG